MKKNILIVEDQEINRRILKKMLSDQYKVFEAVNGEDALSFLCKQGTIISAILLDIVMPIMDGFEVIKEIKKDQILSQIPIIVVSGSDDTTDNKEILALSLGANDFVTKPYKVEIIKHRIANAIRTREASAIINTVQKDSLTGLYSKEFFYICVDKMLKSKTDIEYDIVTLNINGFKVINDLFGSKIGDGILKFLAQKFLEYVGTRGICGRIGDDIFACLIPHMEYKDEYFDLATEEFNKFNMEISISVRFGVYVVKDLSVPIETMCDRALLACNSVKGQFEKKYAYYDESLRQSLVTEQFILNEMKLALKNNEFVVFYQPKYDINTEKIVGAEALVRWNNPQKGFISPGDFIPIFERNGFITALDIYIWDLVCSDLHNWIKQGNEYVPVSVNVSRADIYNNNIVNIFINLIKKYNLQAKDLHLEITESAYTEDSEQLIKIVKELRKNGFIIEMDDFGAGYSSLSMLSVLPLDILKLDMKFVQNEIEKDSRKNILGFVISLAKWMNLLVIAEGVETKKQLEILKNMDCNYVQGYYYSKPLPKPLFEKHLKDHHILKENEIPKIENVGNNSIKVTLSSNKRVMMIVDDIKINRSILTKIFSDSYTIVEADNGLTALEYIKKNKDNIDVILLDLVMPIMDGFKMLSILKSNVKLKDIPVIITSQAGEDNESRSLALGASDFIAKPYNVEVALKRVANVVSTNSFKKLEEERLIFQQMKEMEKKAKTDALTGLFNRTELEMQVNSFFAANKEGKAVFIMMDLDDFKLVNDHYGHTKGDELIQKVALKLKLLFKKEDIVCRMGGDEFAIFLPYAVNEDEINKLLKRITKKFTFIVENIQISASFGVCLTPAFGYDFQTIYQNADTALLMAKRLGKEQYQIYKEDIELPSYVLFRNMDWLLDAASDAIAVCDADNYDMFYMNDVAYKFANKTKKECINKKCYEIFWNKDKPCDHCIKLNKGSKEYCEHEIKPIGYNKSYVIKGKIVDWGGKDARIQFIQDNTAKASFIQQIEDIAKDRKRLLDMIPCGIFRYYAKDDSFDFVSEYMLSMLGYTREEFNDKFHNKFSEMVYYKDRERVLKEIDDQIKVSNTDICEYRIEKGNGELCWVHDVGNIVDVADEKKMFYVTIMDVTKRHQINSELIEEQKKLKIAVNHSKLEYWEHDLLTDTCINRIKDSAFGFENTLKDPSNILLKKKIIPDEYVSLYLKNKELIENGIEFICYDIPLNTKKGKKWYRIRATNLFNELGKPIKTIYTAEDITKLKEYEERYEELLYENKVQTFSIDIKKHCLIDNVGIPYKYGYKEIIADVPVSLVEAGNIHHDDINKYQEMYKKIYNGEKYAESITRWKVKENGIFRRIKVELTTEFDELGNPVKANGVTKLLDNLDDDIDTK